MSQKPTGRNNSYQHQLFWKDTWSKNFWVMGIPEGGMLSEECSWKQPEMFFLTSPVIKHNRSQDFSSDKTLKRRTLQLKKKKKEEKNPKQNKREMKITPENKIQGCNTARGIRLRTVSQQQMLQGKPLQIWLQRHFQAVSWCEGNYRIYMDGRYPCSIRSGYYDGWVKVTIFCLKEAHLSIVLGVRHT